MDKLIEEMVALIKKYEDAKLVPAGVNYYLTPDGCRVENDNDELLFHTNP